MRAINPEAFYIHTADTSVYAMVHRPVGTPSGVAVLMCPSYGWDELCIHRVKFRWANDLAAAGHTVLRFDLPGTGDSSGQATDPDQLRAWLQATVAAANWLRADGATRVVAFGVGLGAMLAWLACAEGTAIDDLMLWRAPSSGRRLVRSLQAAQTFSFAFEGGSDPRDGAEISDDGVDPLYGGFIEESGQIMTGEVIAALKGVDLKERSLSAAAQRRVLLFASPDNADDQWGVDWLATTGVKLEVANGDEFGAMMRYVQLAEVPQAAVATSIAWLANCSPTPVNVRAGETSSVFAGSPSEHEPVTTSTELELETNGVPVRERPLQVPFCGDLLRGTITEPAQTPLAAITVFYLSGASDRRIGPNRLWVERSRQWASLGVRSVRLDLPGLGDSDGDDERWRDATVHFKPAYVEMLTPLFDALQNRGYGERFVLIGFCAGGVKALRASFEDPRIVGVSAIDAGFLSSRWTDKYFHTWWVLTWEPKEHTSRPRIQVMRFAQRALQLTQQARAAALRFGPRALDKSKRQIWRGAQHGTEYLLLIKPELWLLEEIERDTRRDRLAEIEHVTVLPLPNSDDRFRNLVGRRFVTEQLDAALDRVRRRFPTTMPRSSNSDLSPIRPSQISR